MARISEIGKVLVELSDQPRLERLEAIVRGLLRHAECGTWLITSWDRHHGTEAECLLIERNDYV